MERLTILVGRLYKSVAGTKYFFKVKLVGRFMPLDGMISRQVESLLYTTRIKSPHLDPPPLKCLIHVQVLLHGAEGGVSLSCELQT